MRITRTLTTAIAIAALAAPAAQAKPAGPEQRDMHASVAIAAHDQSQRRSPGHAGEPGWNAAPVSDEKPVTQAPVVVADDGGIGWSTIALIAAGLLVAGGIAAAGIRRSPRLRINA